MKKETVNTTIERALFLLELFIKNPEGLTPQEILDSVEISRSTLFILLKELKDLGFIEQVETRGRYKSGPRLLSWSGATSPSYQILLSVFQQEIQNKSLQETVILTVPNPHGILILDQVEGEQRIRAVYQVGEHLSTDSAAGNVLNTPYSNDVIENGHSLVERSEFIELAVPVCADGITPIASLMMNAPQFRWRKEGLRNSWLTEMRAMAARMSYRLGAMQYTPYQQHTHPSVALKTVMSDKQIKSFLSGPWTARLACVRPDGHPHVIPVWQEWDGSKIRIPAWKNSQWVDYVRSNPQVSITVDEPWSPYRRVHMRGIAVEDPNNGDSKSKILPQMSRRYLGQDTSHQIIHQIQTIFSIQPDTIGGWMGLVVEE